MSTLSLSIFGIAGVLTIHEAVRLIRHLFISRHLTHALSKFERLDATGAPRILFVGDSTGHGTGASAPRYSIAGRIGADFPHAHIENVSRSGISIGRARHVLGDIVAREVHSRYDLIIIMISGMNVVHLTPLGSVRRDLQETIKLAKRCSAAVIIVSPNNAGLAPLYRFPLAPLYRWRSRAVRDVYEAVAREEQIDHVTLFHEREDPITEQKLFSRDKMHPNNEGYAVWYDEMKGSIVAALTT